MHTSVSGKITRKTIWCLIFIAALCIPSYGGVIAAQDAPKPPEALNQSQNAKTASKKTASNKNSGTAQSGASCQCTTPCQSSSPNQNACCPSPEAQIVAAQSAAAKEAAAAQNTALQTQAGIDAAKDAAKHAGDMEEEAVKMFCWVSGFTSILLLLMLAVVGIGLAKGQWSLREALSEKPLVHPREGAAIPLPSTSRFIALFGLLGILTMVLGIGYAIIWNLLLYQKPPDNLSDINSFLFGAACLFAPYLANQLRAAFQASPDEKSPDKDGASKAPEKVAETNAGKAA